MNNLNISPVAFTGSFHSIAYEAGNASYKSAKTTLEHDGQIQKLAYGILGGKADYLPQGITRADANKMYDLLEKLTGLKFKRAPLQKVMFYNSDSVILSDVKARILGGETIKIYF